MAAKNITTTPSGKDLNKWADYIELLCIRHPDKLITVGELYDRVNDEEITRSDLDEVEGELDSERDDKKMQIIIDYFNFLSTRVSLFEDFYPFIFNVTNNIIQLKNNLNTKQYIYLYMLFASNLDYFKNDMSDLTSNFEFISFLSLKSTLGPSYTVEAFGVSKFKKSLFNQGKLYDRIVKLAQELNLHLSSRIDTTLSSGDYGLDLVAWLSHDNSEAGPIIFAQCTCGEDWDKKQFDMHFDKWRANIEFVHPPLGKMFISKSFRDDSGDWYNKSKPKTVLFDRKRILDRLSKRQRRAVLDKVKMYTKSELNKKLDTSE
jgi:hypothetical protein